MLGVDKRWYVALNGGGWEVGRPGRRWLWSHIGSVGTWFQIDSRCNNFFAYVWGGD